MDYSIRIPATEERVSWLKLNCISEKELPKIKDYLFKPIGIDLKDYNPNQAVIRIREFIDKKNPPL